MTKQKTDDQDPYLRHNFYEDASLIFSLTNSSVEDIKDDCMIVLDTNVLFIPYETGKDSLSEIQSLLKKFKTQKRLIIPEQVAREFASNRPQRLTKMHQKINEIRSKVLEVDFEYFPILEENDEYQRALEIRKNLNSLRLEYKNKLDALSDLVKSWAWNDPVSKFYGEIFTSDTIRKCSISQKDLPSLHQERFQNNIPPGYKDGGKPDGGIGDLLVWLTILDLAAENKNVLFITGETKADWYHRSMEQGIYPRYELLYEFKLKSSERKNFHILKFSSLLDYFIEDEKTINEIVKIERNEQILDQNSESIENSLSTEQRGYLSELYLKRCVNFIESVLHQTRDYSKINGSFNYLKGIINIDSSRQTGVIILPVIKYKAAFQLQSIAIQIADELKNFGSLNRVFIYLITEPNLTNHWVEYSLPNLLQGIRKFDNLQFIICNTGDDGTPRTFLSSHPINN